MDNGITPLTPAQEAAQEAQSAKAGYFKRNLIAIDDECDALAGGQPGETISSRLARAAERGSKFGILGTKVLNLFQKNHGRGAQAGDIGRAKVVIALEEKEVDSEQP